jgi:L-lactate utilization protein LutC
MTDSKKEYYNDLTPRQRAIVDAYIEDPNVKYEKVAERASEILSGNVSQSYVREVIDDYGDLIDRQLYRRRYCSQNNADVEEDIFEQKIGPNRDSISVGKATRVAQAYVEQYRNDDWERVVGANDKGENWQIEFTTTEFGILHSIIVNKNSGNIINIDFVE